MEALIGLVILIGIVIVFSVLASFGELVVQSGFISFIPLILILGAIAMITYFQAEERKKERKDVVDRWLRLQLQSIYGEDPGPFYSRNKMTEQGTKEIYEAIIQDDNREAVRFYWEWISRFKADTILITKGSYNKSYKTKLQFKKAPGMNDEWIVTRAESVEKSSREKRIWTECVQEQIELLREEVETIQQKQYRRSASQKAFLYYSNAYELDEGVADIMAELYLKGIGTNEDADKADEILMRSAQNGGIEERYRYAKFCLDNGMKTKANEWFEAALLAQNASEHDDIAKEIEQMQLNSKADDGSIF